MFKKGVLADKSFAQKLLVLLGLELIFVSLSTILSLALLQPLFGISSMELSQVLSSPKSYPNGIAALKLVQCVQAASIFLAAPVLFLHFTTTNTRVYLGLKKPSHRSFLPLALIIMLVAGPLIGGLVVWNEQLQLPQALAGIEQWMRASEAAAEALTTAFLQTDTVLGLLSNLLIVAVLAGVGEELLFRGVIQQLLHEKTAQIHTAILITAVLFSAIHMQFYGFFPRMIMGVMLGYMYYWSGSLWVPMLAHVVNNGFAVLMSYLYYKKISTINPDDETIFSGSVILLSLFAVILLGYYAYTKRAISSVWQD